MTTEIRVPTLGESVTEATIGQWFRKQGDEIRADEPLVELETDKVTIEVPAPVSGVLSEIAADNGETVEVGALLGSITEGEVGETGVSGGPDPVGLRAESEEAGSGEKAAEARPAKGDKKGEQEVRREAGEESDASAGKKSAEAGKAMAERTGGEMPPAPAARKLMAEKGIDAGQVTGSGRRGQILKEDVVAALDRIARAPEPAEAPAARRAPAAPSDEEREQRVRMSRLRQTIARRLKDAQNTAAMLTTFNEVDMGAIMELRNEYKVLFERKNNIKLGFMGFFVKSVVQALKEIPAVNAEIDGEDLIFKNYYHIGVAVGTDRGLVVPVVRDADAMSMAEIEMMIADYGRRARDGDLKIEEMQGGTFTISNGGVYGSLMSTPILNAPQSGILGMHKIQDRPVAIDGEIKIRPMMYLALSYDHRIVDGKDAVTFLVRVKETIEDPRRLMLEL